MDWWIILILIIGGLIILIFKRMPVAFAFMFINILAIILVQGSGGLNQLILSIYDSLKKFSLTPIPLFIFMGEILFLSGLAMKAIDVIAMWLRAVPGRLAILAVIGGGTFGALSGSAIGNTAMLGSLLLPEMEERGYDYRMSVGPILASGGLAMVIPPSAVAIILGTLAKVSIGKILIAGLLPGILMGIVYCGYIILRCWINPQLAPVYEVINVPLKDKLYAVVRDVLPLGVLIVVVISFVSFGVATPTETAALGAFASILVAAAKGKINFDIFKKAVASTVNISAMTLIIIAGSTGFSQIISYTGVTKQVIEVFLNLNMSTITTLIMIQILLLILGAFLDQVSIMMITLPFFMPLVNILGLDPVWFLIVMLINLEIANTTPPVGLLLFVIKGVAPKGVTMGQIYLSAVPFIICDLISMTLIILFPSIALWLPSIMN